MLIPPYLQVDREGDTDLSFDNFELDRVLEIKVVS